MFLFFDVPNDKPATTAQATPKKRTSTIQIHAVSPQGKLKNAIWFYVVCVSAANTGGTY